MRLIAAATALAAVGLLATAALCDPGGKALNVLFVVGGRVHDSENLPPMLKDVLEKSGDFSITITQDRDHYRSENIRRYDVVMMYTTRGEVTSEQEAGLVDFVRNGGGVVSIHGSTSSFPDSDACWKLLGGRFTQHGSGTFTVKMTAKRHCIARGLADFEIHEETYNHDFHPESKLIVLMRRDTDSAPVSWVQYYGEGRVFATALGHDKKTWERPEFREMVRRGLLWAGGRMD